MRIVFRCSARNWLLFVVEPLAVLTVSPCVCMCLFMCVCASRSLRVCMHACRFACVCYVCICVKRSGYFALLQMCQCSVWSPAQLFHVIVPPTVCALPASRLISLSRQPPLSPLFLPSLTLSLCLHRSSSFFNILCSFPSVPQHQWGYQDVNCMGVPTRFSPLIVFLLPTLCQRTHF